MTKRIQGVAGFHLCDPMLIYRNEGAEPERLGTAILNELKECTRGNDITPYIDRIGREWEKTEGSAWADGTLLCNWGYVLNLNNDRFEILRGDQTKEPNEPVYKRFGMDEPFRPWESCGLDKIYYFPSRIVKAYDLRDLPDEQQFLEDLEPFKSDPHHNLKSTEPPWYPWH